MLLFFQIPQSSKIYAVQSEVALPKADLEKLQWLFGGAKPLENAPKGFFVGPRKEMITPWSTNAVEITQNMGIRGILRIEEFAQVPNAQAPFDPMLYVLYEGLGQTAFDIDNAPVPVLPIEDIQAYNSQEGLALSEDEVEYLEAVSQRIGRKLTDSEVFGFSQVNSEHCRHKIFNGTFIIDGEEKPLSLFKLIKRTAHVNPNRIVSAYKDNVAFVKGPKALQFAPTSHDGPAPFQLREIDTVLSLKAETHNFPTTVEPFNGAATGSGGEIRDRMAGGRGSIPLAGTAVYMTPYSRLEEGRSWEKDKAPRNWRYQTPIELLIKASNGASDFGNKFGQPLICGSVLTFEHSEKDKEYGYDKVIMQAGGIGFGRVSDSLKDSAAKGDKIVVLGGDNYRIGMGGGAVSSVATGQFSRSIELNAVQRSNPEMQKRVYNAIRAMAETGDNPVISIHDHGAGGHLNCLSELVEEQGGHIDVDKLPIGDPTLSGKEIIGNESQERMGLLLKKKDIELLQRIADRERAPMYVVGDVTGDQRLTFEQKSKAEKPIDLRLEDMFGKPPRTIMQDRSQTSNFKALAYKQDVEHVVGYIQSVLQLEAVACKDWLTNKVDRSVTGRVATQQTTGEIQLPLNNVGVMALDYNGEKGIATSIGHAPVAALIDPKAGSRLAVAEALTNMVWAPLEGGLSAVSLSANWMWPCRNEGEDARLYSAVEELSDFVCQLGINVPTGKDSLSMVQKYPDGKAVYAPGTVIVSAVGEVTDLKKTVSPDVKLQEGSAILYVDFSSDDYHLGGSSFAQSIKAIGKQSPTVKNASYFAHAFNAIQDLINEGQVLAGHDISAGGLITALLEMTFPTQQAGLIIDLQDMHEDLVQLLFSEKPAVLLQVEDAYEVQEWLANNGIASQAVAYVNRTGKVAVFHESCQFELGKNELRDLWMRPSYLLDKEQTGGGNAEARYQNYKLQPLQYSFPNAFMGKLAQYGLDKPVAENRPKAAIIREKGVNGDREMAYSMFLAGFEVYDVHMTDLVSGRENLEQFSFIVYVGGFSNSDVLGSAKGWAGAFLYNEKAKRALDNFYARPDTLSLGVCNGCQLMMELGLVTPSHEQKPSMLHNASGKFESTFINMSIPENHSVMLSSLAGSRLGVWVAHGEGQFAMPYEENSYHIVGKYSYSAYPANPNGSAFDTAALASDCGRHLAMMPHLERSLFPWQWPHYPAGRKDEVSPWLEAFVNAREWVERQG